MADTNFYTDRADWWPLCSPPQHYDEVAADLPPRLGPLATGRPTVLELGSGGGSLAWHLKPHFALTLTDRHVEGLFPRAAWFEAFDAVGLRAQSTIDRWGRDIFTATPA